MRKVRVRMTAYTRQEFDAVVAVPDDMSDTEIGNQLSDAVDSDDYEQDYEYWDRGDTEVEEIEDEECEEPEWIVEPGAQRFRARRLRLGEAVAEFRSEE